MAILWKWSSINNMLIYTFKTPYNHTIMNMEIQPFIMMFTFSYLLEDGIIKIIV
jgi:hypothetical protein